MPDKPLLNEEDRKQIAKTLLAGGALGLGVGFVPSWISKALREKSEESSLAPRATRTPVLTDEQLRNLVNRKMEELREEKKKDIPWVPWPLNSLARSLGLGKKGSLEKRSKIEGFIPNALLSAALFGGLGLGTYGGITLADKLRNWTRDREIREAKKRLEEALLEEQQAARELSEEEPAKTYSVKRGSMDKEAIWPFRQAKEKTVEAAKAFWDALKGPAGMYIGLTVPAGGLAGYLVAKKRFTDAKKFQEAKRRLRERLNRGNPPVVQTSSDLTSNQKKLIRRLAEERLSRELEE